jgi:hypothetical protein
MISRRAFIGAISAAFGSSAFAGSDKPKHILIANCWHDCNIGDIAQAPGLLSLIAEYLPEVGVTLWPYPTPKGPGEIRDLTPDVRRMLTKAFPNLMILEPGGSGQRQGATRPDLVAAIARADLFILGSGGYHAEPVRIWQASTDKPFGIYGVTFGKVDRQSLSRASFIFCRDSKSVRNVREAKVTSPLVEFGPDSTFAFRLRNDELADGFLRRTGLEDQRFLCVIPRLRFSPYHEIYGYEPDENDLRVADINAQFKDSDHAAARELIVNWVRATGLKVLACPEMTYGVPLAKEQLVDPLPPDVRRQVVWRDTFWLSDEAASVFAKSLAVVSLDCHAPIISLAAGTPAIHLRQRHFVAAILG